MKNSINKKTMHLNQLRCAMRQFRKSESRVTRIFRKAIRPGQLIRWKHGENFRFGRVDEVDSLALGLESRVKILTLGGKTLWMTARRVAVLAMEDGKPW